MSWNSVIDQERAKGILRRSVEQGRVAHAYLFWGPRGVGKDALAIEFAKTLLCERQGNEACDICASCRKVENLQHPNLRLVFAMPAGRSEKPGENGEGKLQTDVRDEVRAQLEQKAKDPYFHIEIPRASQINIGSIRELKKESSYSAFEKGRKIFIISDAELMNDASGNSMLKVLEEPLSDTMFLLTSARREKLLPTIVSRCQSIRCEILSEDAVRGALISRQNIPEEQARVISRLAGGDYSYALDLLSGDVSAKRGEAVSFLRAVLGGHDLKLMEEVELQTAENDRGSAEQFLLLLLTWLRDAMIMKEEGAGRIVNEDQVEDLGRFLARFGNADFPATIGAVERALELLRGNVYLPLVFLSLSVRLKRLLMNER